MRESFQRLRQRSLVGEVRDEIERMILHGEMQAGERLNEIGLAEQLGVSRGPVREAARSLEQQGLVTTVTNQGVFVRKLSLQEALELYDLRALVAGHLCACVAERATAEELAKLRHYVDRMDRAISDRDENRYFELNLAFHDQVAIASGASRSRVLYTSLGKEVRLLRMRVLTGDASLTLSNAEHDRIVTALERKDPDAARDAGAQHHINAKARLLETQ
ncbi:MAG: GntR family transcriptional regulator [Pseudomonadota bacterium]